MAVQDVGWWLTQLTTLLVAATGIAVFFVRPRTPPARALALLLVSYGIGVLALNVSEEVHTGGLAASAAMGLAAEYVGAAGAFGTAIGAGLLLATFPRRLSSRERASGWILAAFLCVALVVAVPFARATLARAGEPLVPHEVPGLLTFEVGLLAMLGTVAGLAIRHRSLDATPENALPRTQLRTMAAGLAVPASFTLAFNLLDPGLPLIVVTAAGLSLLVTMLTWIYAAQRGPDGAASRAIAWIVGAAALAPMMLRASGIDPDNGGAFGLMRLVSFAILAWGLLRGQLLGLDVKVRWTISQSTIAAAFIAMFFVASEAAQQFFGDTLGSTYVGIVAAGALVFGLAPLQRAADRLARTAVPDASAGQPRPASSNVSVAYKAALRAAMRDGHVTRREERHLAEMALALGVDPLQAHEWRDEVERESATTS